MRLLIVFLKAKTAIGLLKDQNLMLFKEQIISAISSAEEKGYLEVAIWG